jgi:hypothetical protein
MLSGRGGLKVVSVMVYPFAMVEMRYAATGFTSRSVSKVVVGHSVPEINATAVRATSRIGTVGPGAAPAGIPTCPLPVCGTGRKGKGHNGSHRSLSAMPAESLAAAIRADSWPGAVDALCRTCTASLSYHGP